MTSGKTTIANLLLDEIENSKRLTLAEPIHQIVENLDRMDNRQLVEKFIIPYYESRNYIEVRLALDIPESFFRKWDNILDRTRLLPLEKPKPRKRLQFLGTDGARNLIDDKIWIKIAINKSKKEPNVSWIIDDCRFINEYNAFIKAGWQPLFLHISKDIQHKRLSKLYGEYDPNILKHPSELEIDKICIPTDCIVNANQNLKQEIEEIRNFLWKKENFL